jgi:hypothetical protein
MTRSSPMSCQSEHGYRRDQVRHYLVTNVWPHHQVSIDHVLAVQSSPNISARLDIKTESLRQDHWDLSSSRPSLG